MTLVNRLAEWRDPKHWDVGHVPTEEEALGTFLYSFVTDFVEQKWRELHDVMTDPNGDLDALANAFVDEYAAA